MDGAALALTAARGVHLAASLSALGIVVFELGVAPTILRRVAPEIRDEIDGRLVLLWRLSLAVAIACGLAWLAAETIAVVDEVSLSSILDSLWPMLTDTRFGRVLACRLGLLVLAALLLLRRRQGGPLVAAALATGVAAMLHVAASHAAAIEAHRSLAVVVEALHLLAAGIWLGSLPPLLVVVDRLPPPLARACLLRFSPLAGACVGVLVATALIQGWILIGELGGLLGTDYGLVALLKVALLLAMLGLAAATRCRLTPALAGDLSGRSRAWLRRSIGLEAVIGLAVVLAAAALADLAPAAHGQAM